MGFGMKGWDGKDVFFAEREGDLRTLVFVTSSAEAGGVSS